VELFIVFLVFIFLSVYSASRSSKKKKPKSSKNRIRKNPIPQAVYEWPDHGDEFDIVGESHYQGAIKSLAGPNDEHVRNKEYRAFLVPEDNNPYDNKAVRVDIEGMTVGYLSRDDAPSFRRRLAAKKLAGQITACKAWVIGGRGPNGEKWSYGICLGIKEFEY
jgi:hypothetical protein